MRKLKNKTLQKFIDDLVSSIKEEKANFAEEGVEWNIDIPFVVSSLYQNFKHKENEYTDLIKDLEERSYSIDVYNSNIEDYYDLYLTAEIIFDRGKYKEHFKYTIQFFLDERNYCYCECTPDMKDYREDKKCCGHGCDATFCSFILKKEIEVNHGEWMGDEHDYWIFEDTFLDEEETVKEITITREIEEIKSFISQQKKTLQRLEEKLQEIKQNRKSTY